MKRVANLIRAGEIKNIILMTGAGISCSAGIPDFRTPGTGLYSKLQKYSLPTPESMFDLDYFRGNPEPFFDLARSLYPGKHRPTLTHFFIKLLHKKKLLLRNYTQNIDMLERLAGIPSCKLVEAHGTWATASCIECGAMEDGNWVKMMICKKQEHPVCRVCEGLLKPDIIFFGEPICQKLEQVSRTDFRDADLLIVAGTSLQVQPFAGLIERVAPFVPRMLFNLDPVGLRGDYEDGSGFLFGHPDNFRDICVMGECDKIIAKFAELLRWKHDLMRMVDAWQQPDLQLVYSP